MCCKWTQDTCFFGYVYLYIYIRKAWKQNKENRYAFVRPNLMLLMFMSLPFLRFFKVFPFRHFQRTNETHVKHIYYYWDILRYRRIDAISRNVVVGYFRWVFFPCRSIVSLVPLAMIPSFKLLLRVWCNLLSIFC